MKVIAATLLLTSTCLVAFANPLPLLRGQTYCNSVATDGVDVYAHHKYSRADQYHTVSYWNQEDSMHGFYWFFMTTPREGLYKVWGQKAPNWLSPYYWVTISQGNFVVQNIYLTQQ